MIYPEASMIAFVIHVWSIN